MQFSIVIPSHNRAKTLKKTLRSLSMVKYEKELFEVIVVENLPENEETQKVVKFFQKQIKHLYYFEINRRGASYARNFGAQKAAFSHIIFIDDDIEVTPQFLIGYKNAWEVYPQSKILGGKIVATALSKKPFDQNQKKLIEKFPWCFAQLDYGEKDFYLKLRQYVFSANLSIYRESKQEKIFDTRLGTEFYKNIHLGAEDYELCCNTILSRKPVIYCANKKIKVTHNVHPSRFSAEYLLRRHILSGIEMCLMEDFLAEKFPKFNPFFFKSNFSDIKQTYTTLTTRYLLFSIASYLLNKKLFTKFQIGFQN